MKRTSFDETAPVVVSQGPQPIHPPVPCRCCTKLVQAKYLMEQGGLCRNCYGNYLERGNVGIGIYRGAQA